MDEEQFDETYVRPVLESTVPDSGELFHLGVELVSGGGVSRPGCVELFDGAYRFPGTFLNGELCDLEPTGSDTYLSVNGVLDPKSEHSWMKRLEAVFDQPFELIFPIRWRLKLPHGYPARADTGVMSFIPHKGCEWREDDV